MKERESIEKAHAVLDASGLAGKRSVNHKGLADRIEMAIAAARWSMDYSVPTRIQLNPDGTWNVLP